MKLVDTYTKLQEQELLDLSINSDIGNNRVLNRKEMEKAIRQYLRDKGASGNLEPSQTQIKIDDFIRYLGVNKNLNFKVPYEEDKRGRTIYYKIDSKGNFIRDENDNLILAINPKYNDDIEEYGLDSVLNSQEGYDDLYDTRPTVAMPIIDRVLGLEIHNAFKKNVELALQNVFSGIIGKSTRKKGTGDFRNLLNKTPGKFELLIYKPEYWDYSHPDIKNVKGIFLSIPITHHKGDIKNLSITDRNFSHTLSQFAIVSPPGETTFYIDEIYSIKLTNPSAVSQLDNYPLKSGSNIFKIKVAGFNDYETKLNNQETELDLKQDDDFLSSSLNIKCIYYAIKEIAYAVLRIGELYKKENPVTDSIIDKNFTINLTKVLNKPVSFSKGEASIMGYFKRNLNSIDSNNSQKDFSLPVFINFINSSDYKELFLEQKNVSAGCVKYFENTKKTEYESIYEKFYVDSIKEFIKIKGDTKDKQRVEDFYLSLISKVVLEFVASR